VIFCVLEGLKGDSAVCVYCYCSWDVIIDMRFLYCFLCFNYSQLFSLFVGASNVWPIGLP